MYLINTDYNTLEVRPEEIWKSLGWKNQKVSEELKEKTESIIDKAKHLIKPKSVLLTGDLVKTEDSLSFYGIELGGKTIKNFLETSGSAALMAVTLGIEIDREIKRLERTDLTSALLLDACASLLVEALCDKVSDDLALEMKEENLYTTERFSPGYSDLPLELQPKLLNLLDTQRKLGLTTTSTNLLIPRKSVTAFIGIMDKPREIRSSRCNNCILKGKCKYGICYHET